MKKPLLITLAVLACLAGGYFAYTHFFGKPKTTAWDLVPTETVLVYESSACASCINEIRNSPIAELIRRTASHSNGNDSLAALTGFLTSFQFPTLVSLHITGKDQFDFVYYIQGSPGFTQQFSHAVDAFGARPGAKQRERQLNDITIHELEAGGRIFSWIQVDEIYVHSFSPVLIEDVIRTVARTDDPDFRTSISSVYQLPRIKNDAGNLYVHLTNLAQWLAVFTSEAPGDLIRNFGHSSLLDFRSEENLLILNGFSTPAQTRKNLFLTAFQDQVPVESRLRGLISNRTLAVTSFALSDGKKFFTRLAAVTPNPHRDSVAAIFNTINIPPARPFEEFSGEIAVCALEGRKESLQEIAVIHFEQGLSQWKEAFAKLSAATEADTAFVDRYASYEIREIPVYRFPDKFLYPLVSGFDASYYTFSGNALFIAPNIEELKKFLADIDQENTWGKSVVRNRFFESTLLEANVSVHINTPRVWTMLRKMVKPRWKTFIEENESLLSGIGMVSMQFSHLNDTYYTNLAWAFSQPGKENNRVTNDRFIASLDTGIYTMQAVRNHSDRSTELLVQDSAKALTLYGADAKPQWTLALDGFIAGDVEQVDYFNNGKLQYFFATPGSLHVVDRTGQYVKPFPVAITETDIGHVGVADYDNSKKYRFLVSSRTGRLWMFDKEGKNLEGWQPRSVDEGLITGVRHHRLVGRDYLLAVRTDGVVYLMNRRGELVRNFPLDLNARLAGNYFLEPGKNAAETVFTVVSADGVKIRFNLLGKIVSQEVLVKNAPQASFFLTREQGGKTYVVVRQEPRQFSVFNEDGGEIFQGDYLGNNPVRVTHYSFGNGRDYTTITDLSQQLAFVYGRAGALVTPVPISADRILLSLDDRENLRLFAAYDRSLVISLLK